MKIAVFGGSFNPITIGHTNLCNYLIEHGVVDLVLVMPCYKSLYNKDLVDGEHRLNMIKLASKNNRYIQAFDFEIRNKIEGVGTYDIMTDIKKSFTNDDLYFVIGADNSQKVKKWIKGDLITKDFKFIVVPRNGTDLIQLWFTEEPHIYLRDYSPDSISSTTVRTYLRKSMYDETILDYQVFQYILSNNLYKGA